VPNTSITLIDEESGFRHAVRTGTDGAYWAGSLAPGLYKITVRKEGFRTIVQFHVRVGASEPARADFALTLGSVQETITVESSPLELPRRSASVATNLTRVDLEKLPLDGRGLLGLVELAPGTNVVPATRGDAGQFVTNGQRPNTNYFTVDGIAANNGVSAGGLPAQPTGASLPVLSAFGSLDSMIPVDAVQDFEIQTSTSEAQFGRLPGANVAVRSRSGSDEFHASAAYAFRHELLAANDWFANRSGEPRSALREHNVNAALGGPLRRDRTFFFVDYEWTSLVQPFAWLEPVPSMAARAAAPAWAQPVLALFPQPNGPFLAKGLAEWNGRNSRPGGLQAGSARLDQSLTSRLSLFARYADSPSYNQFGSTQVNHLDFRSWSGTAGVTFHANSNIVLDSRLNWSATTANSVWSGDAGCELLPLALQFLPTSATCDLLVRFQINGVGQLTSGREGSRRQGQFQVTQSVAWTRGSHAMRFGADFLRVEPERQDAAGSLSVIADSVSALDNSSTFWLARSAPRSVSTRVDEFSLWLHDTWRLRPNLTLVGGIRWEYTPPPDTGAGVNFLDPVTGTVQSDSWPLWPPPYGHFAPRLGLAFSPGASRRTVLRAGAGLYLDSSLSIATDVINGGPMSLDFTSARFAPFSALLTYGFMPDLRLPQVLQWSASVERSITAQDLVYLGYAGAEGQDLIRREVGGPGSTPTAYVALTTNHGSSSYNALIAQYRRRVSRGLEALVSYSWSHALDNASSDAFLLWAGPGSDPARDHASSDFDLRHSLSAALNYQLPGVAKGWSLATMVRAHTGFPITVLSAEQYMGIDFMNAFRPNLVPGVPLWIPGGAFPGGEQLNPQAFQAAPVGQQGDLGRNALAGFGMWQMDLSVRREFRIAERRALDLRIEAFNLLNHPNFADPVRYLNNPLFGQSTSMLNMMLGTGSPASGLAPLLQNGRPRSVEAVLRFRF
jgi:hypothetical protein